MLQSYRMTHTSMQPNDKAEKNSQFTSRSELILIGTR